MELKDKLDVLKTILALKKEGFDKKDINGYFEMLETSPAAQAGAAQLSAEEVNKIKQDPKPDSDAQSEEKNKEETKKTVEEILQSLL